MNRARFRIARPYRLWAITLSGAAAALPMAAIAQSAPATGSREVVQALPSPEVERLNDALRRLARNSRDVDALIDAGNAALQIGDNDAAIGFFGRAQELSPGNAKAKLGMAAVYIRSDRPIDALRLFAEAESAGTPSNEFHAERGLAYDLVGNNDEAQRSYRAAQANRPSNEVIRRLAISQAIAGDRAGFEATLLPQLQQRDFAAYRARAFGLAILGDLDEATEIAEAVMPRELSSRIAPYLAYMPQLTKAQQAAAANLGIFPRAAQIGRDDPRIAQYATSGSVKDVGGKLAPQGEPLGAATRAETDSRRRRPDRTGSRSQAARTTDRTRELPPASDTSRLAAVAREQAAAQESAKPGARPEARPDARPSVSTFNLADMQGAQDKAGSAARETPSVDAAFAGMDKPVSSSAAPAAGAVNIAAIEVPREAPPKPAKPEPPRHPSRFWVQVATGRDVSALRFDWRRFARQAPELLGEYNAYVTPWGQANRLLAGPLPSSAAARDLVNALKAKGLDSFTYTSPEGEEINKIQ